jgi:hypothetical protein
MEAISKVPSTDFCSNLPYFLPSSLSMNYSDTERRLILENARLTARCAVLMQAMATIARRGGSETTLAQSVVKAADNAALNVRWEDLTQAKTQ